MKLDYSLSSTEERTKYVSDLISTLSPSELNHTNLEYLSDYIIDALNKNERRSRTILTNNRLYTINKRETSFENLVSKLENGEDGIYGLVETGRNLPLTQKKSITPEDIAEMPELAVLRAAIDKVAAEEKNATGRRKYYLKKQLIEMRQDQYVIKDCLKQTKTSRPGSAGTTPDFNAAAAEITVTPDGTVIDSSLISYFNPNHISALLCNYSRLKQDSWGRFCGDTFYMMLDLDRYIDLALAPHPLYLSLLTYKIDGLTNEQIQERLLQEFGTTHTVEYISSLWRKKIPKLIAEAALDDYLNWYYTEKERGHWKRCSKCKTVKLAHPRFFSRNNTSKDGYYSQCKQCRNSKNKDKTE